MNKSNRQEKKNRRENKVLYGAEISKKENFEKENRESPEKEIFGLWRKGTIVHTGVGGLPFPPRWVLELRTLERTEILHCSVSFHKIGKSKTLDRFFVGTKDNRMFSLLNNSKVAEMPLSVCALLVRGTGCHSVNTGLGKQRSSPAMRSTGSLSYNPAPSSVSLCLLSLRVCPL